MHRRIMRPWLVVLFLIGGSKSSLLHLALCPSQPSTVYVETSFNVSTSTAPWLYCYSIHGIEVRGIVKTTLDSVNRESSHRLRWCEECECLDHRPGSMKL